MGGLDHGFGFGELEKSEWQERAESRTPPLLRKDGAPEPTAQSKEEADSSAFAPQNDGDCGWAILLS
jgi:hypothetical protein